MFQLTKNIFNPLFSLILVLLSAGYFVTYSTLLLNEQGYSDYLVGLMHAAYYVGMFLSAFVCERLLSHLGLARSFALAGTISSISILIMSCTYDPWTWIAMRFLAGACMGMVYIVIESWLLAYSTEFIRGRILAIYTIFLYTAQAAGQHLLDIVSPLDSIPFIVAAALTMAGVLPLLYDTRTVPYKASESEISSSWLQMLKNSPFGVLGGAFSGAILGAIYSFSPIFAVDYSISPAQLMSITIFGGVALQWPLGKISDHFNRHTVLIATSLLILIPSTCIFLFPTAEVLVLISSFLLGGLSFTIYPQSISCVIAQGKNVSFPSAVAVLLLTYGLGSSFGPIFASFFTSSSLGSSSLYLYFSCISLLLAFLGIATFQQKKLAVSKEIS